MRILRRWITALGVVTLAVGLIALAGGSMGNGVAEAAENHGFNRSDLDTTCKPCEDFYQFATGGWRAHNPIPAAYPTWGRFNLLQAKNQEVLHKILEAAAKERNAAPGSIDQKIGDFYGACMDTKRIDAEGIKPLEPELERIAKIGNPMQLQDEVARLQSRGIGAMFRFTSTQDDKNSTQVIGIAMQGGLGLPDRDYYTKQDDHSKQIRKEYLEHVARMLELAGDRPEQAKREAETVLKIETGMAQASKTRVERRDPQANYHKMDPAQMRALTPDFSWARYFRNVGFPKIREVNIAQPEFFQALDKQLTSVPLADWKVYLRWHLIHSSARALPSNFVEEDFHFYGRTLTGAKQLRPRWKRCVAATDENLGEDLGQRYVAVAFPPQAKAQARKMVENLVAALRSDIETLPWMSPPTRKQALAKLDAITLKIGYPDKWRDYSAYLVVHGHYLENFQRGRLFEFRRNLAQIGKPVDRTEWEMTPSTVNAYYDPNMNEIVFPAGILQPPFFDPSANPALNYGGIGSVIGHEMTHGFDDQGSQYDAKGNLVNWWTPADLKNFKSRAACIEKQFDAFRVTDDLHENGKLVVGESIADLGGLTLAHMAFERTLAGKPAPPQVDGFTPDQLFFLAWGRIWATNSRPQFERLMVNVDPHPLARFRVNGPVSNMESFAKAFSCPLKSPMVRPAEERCKIW